MSDRPFQPPTTNALQGLATAYYRSSKLTEVQKTELSRILTTKLGTRPCEMCGQFTWSIGDNLVQPMPLNINHLTFNYSVDYGLALPSVHLVCTNCGNTKLFLLSQLGFNPFAAT